MPLTCNGPVLVILDSLTEMNNMSPHLEALLTSPTTHIIILYTSSSPPTSLVREIDTKLVRGCTVLQLEPLFTIHSTQRMVHDLLSRRRFAPQNRDQVVLAQLASLTYGCPDLSKLMAEVVYRQCLRSNNPLDDLASQLVRPVMAQAEPDRLLTFFDYIINLFDMDTPQYFVLQVLAMFGPVPILQSVAVRVQTLVMAATSGGRSCDFLQRLVDSCLLKVYPSPVVVATSMMGRRSLYSVPCHVCEAVLRSVDERDVILAIATAHKAVTMEMATGGGWNGDQSALLFCAGLCRGLASTAEGYGDSLGTSCMGELYRPLVQLECEGHLTMPWSTNKAS